MYSWSAAYEQMHSVMYKQKDMFPYPSSCSDSELYYFWDETLDKYEHYLDVYDRTEFESEYDEECFVRKIEELEDLLDDIDFEWERRPWLNK